MHMYSALGTLENTVNIYSFIPPLAPGTMSLLPMPSGDHTPELGCFPLPCAPIYQSTMQKVFI